MPSKTGGERYSTPSSTTPPSTACADSPMLIPPRRPSPCGGDLRSPCRGASASCG
jgi:hypothetical protein